MTFGERLKFFREAQHMTQEQLAVAVGVAKSTITGYEKGNREPDVMKIKKIAAALKITGDDLLGISPNTFKSTISVTEQSLISKYRQLDKHGKKFIDLALENELRHMDEIVNASSKVQQSSKVAYMEDYADKKRTRRIPLYALSAGAGNGVFLDSNDYELIDITLDSMSEQATFAVRVSGDSMEPKYSTGDILLVKTQPEVEIGELGIFILNGEGFFKKYGGDHLISLNDAYDDIVFKEYDDISCKGKVLGALEED